MTPTNGIPPRRRILYIRHKRTTDITDGFRLNQDEWVETLSMLADVTLCDSDFDMDEICDRVRPDFILYESPFFCAAPLSITNVAAHPHIPRIGFLMQDVYCAVRVKFLRTCEALNIKYIFTHMTETALRQSPELAPNLFSVSLLFDDRVFREYSLQKDIPVSVFGGFLLPELYQWRAETTKHITDHFPTLIYTHPGYNNPVPRAKFPVSGEAYARLLNRSHFSLADSTHFDCLVRKHLEISASGAVLIAPDAPVLAPYGFRDMENCILGAGNDLFEKMAVVANDPDSYERIRKNGFDLVHAKYSRRNWRGILDFFECLRTLKPGETVQQQGMLGPFKAVPYVGPSMPAIAAVVPDSAVSMIAKDWLGKILNNADLYRRDLKMPDWLPHTLEPLIPLGLAALLDGDLIEARERFLSVQRIRIDQAGYAEYDPEEIAWLSLTAALMGDAELLAMTRQQSAAMRHLSLRRITWLGTALAAGKGLDNPPPETFYRAEGDQISTHWTGQIDIDDWVSLITRMLCANGQSDALSPRQQKAV